MNSIVLSCIPVDLLRKFSDFLVCFKMAAFIICHGMMSSKFQNPIPEEWKIFSCHYIVNIYQLQFSWRLHHFSYSD